MMTEMNDRRPMRGRRLKIGLLGLSDPAPVPQELIDALDFAEVRVSEILSLPTTGKQRAEVWNRWMAEGDFDWIFDVSGGNLSTLSLPWLDLTLYAKNDTVFAGYSDLSPILNALVKATKKPCLLFSARQNIPALRNYLTGKDDALTQPDWSDPSVIAGQVIAGGNIRCLLKLAGTPWWPDLAGKVLFLEARSGNAYAIASMVAQLCSMKVMDQIAGLALGQFTELQDPLPVVNAVLSQMGVRRPLPVTVTPDVGHAAGSLGLWIGKEMPG